MTLTDNAVVPSGIDRRNDHALAGLALVILADVLFFQQPLGVNAFAFAMAVAAGILLADPRRLKASAVPGLSGLSFIAAAPLLEAPTLLGAVSASCGLILVALIRSKLIPARFTRLPRVLFRFALAAPMRLAQDCRKHFGNRASRHTTARVMPGLIVWLVPAVFALIFVSLFALANPVIEQAISTIDLSRSPCLVQSVAYRLLASRCCFGLAGASAAAEAAQEIVRPGASRQQRH